VLRPWVAIRPGFEFRIYVSNGKITCGSQYENVFYPEVWEKKDWLQKQLHDFVTEKVIPKLFYRLPSFVVDVVLTEQEKFLVCELNPFAASSSACLFSWSQDRTQILIGPEVWRFVDPSSKGTPQLPDSWKKWLENEFPSRRKGMMVGIVLTCVAVLANQAVQYLNK